MNSGQTRRQIHRSGAKIAIPIPRPGVYATAGAGITTRAWIYGPSGDRHIIFKNLFGTRSEAAKSTFMRALKFLSIGCLFAIACTEWMATALCCINHRCLQLTETSWGLSDSTEFGIYLISVTKLKEILILSLLIGFGFTLCFKLLRNKMTNPSSTKISSYPIL